MRTTPINLKDFPLVAQDKSRDIHTLSDTSQLVVYTDRLYAYDAEMLEIVPDKGIMLNQISNYWMHRFTHLAGNYLAAPEEGLPEALLPYASALAGRCAIVRKLKPLPFQFLTIGSLGGSDWQAYKETGMVRGQFLPRGLQESERMDQVVMIPISTNDTENNDDGRRRAQRLLGQKLFTDVEEVCLSVFGVARNYAAARGLSIADARFEFGLVGGNICMINEVMTPDVATYWPGDPIPGEPQPVFERQNMYSWLKVQRWNPKQPPPSLPDLLIKEVVKRYRVVCDIMTGKVPTLKKQEEEENAAAENEDEII
ncbi:MAG: phosphoribosylaminoimidazolesuccinocarboxamide synthase [Deltaproteobacteria bacterium]|jgi:phosphoribosylaminoimidazole-succinocarboxamide synthase|nr:phosphoribosylaminoimidazolesuccinocarboxamide synthase [Deltaproteobacteria bacterium]